uniref:EF-hand calcium-binding domain-containing protein 6 isoform X2 n=1 Tax=Jaculus jaculus TaxID=51337 RepID=UPI001E1B0595|nr:EF-hand calcium-binding domain-containing protein 6 isoform X2 [Jaculus jaculus]
MQQNSIKANTIKANITKSGSTKARDLMHRMAIIPDWHILYSRSGRLPYSQAHSSPCRVHSRNGSQGGSRSPSSTINVVNPVLSFFDVKRILFQKITSKKDELMKVFKMLDTGQNLTVTKGELRRTIATFLLPLTREQFQDVLAQIPLTCSGNVPYLEFLSKFGGIDLNINAAKRVNGNEMVGCRKVNELEAHIGDQVSKNMKTIIKAFKLIDVNNTGQVKPQELRRILEAFCSKMSDEEYERLCKHYNIDEGTAVDYNMFLKNLGISNDINCRYVMIQPELSGENQQARDVKKEQLPSSASSEDTWKSFNLDELERIFSQELLRSFEKIEKALSAGDPSQGGYISLNYLKVVLDTFIHYLPRRIFIQLMKRFGLKTTTRINWKQFLKLFCEHPKLELSKTVPPKKISSVDSRNRAYKENIIKKLFLQSEDHHASLKKALLVMSSVPDGKMPWEELRHILNCMVTKLSDSAFKELVQTLDPEGTGMVKISTLLDMLPDSPEVRKVSPPTDNKTPLSLDWDSVDKMVCDAISRNLRAFYTMLQSYDLGDTGSISRANFKKVMHIFCPYLKNEHFIKLFSKFYDSVSGRVLYKKLLACLGSSSSAAVSPLLGSQDQLSGQFQKEGQDQPSLPERTPPVRNTPTRTKNMTKEEVIEKLKVRIQQQDPVFRRHFLSVSQTPDGKVSMQDFRKVLEDSGMPMDDVQYALLASKLGYKKEGMSYLDFASGFEETQPSEPERSPPPTSASSKPHVDSYFISAEECLKLFPKRLKESFRDPYSAFFKVDTDRDGIINMHDLHRLLLQLLLNMKDEEYERFLGLLGLRLSVTLNFREFQNLCEKRPVRSDDAPQRSIRTKQKVADSELACEQAHQYLALKAKTRWADLSKNFIETDNEGNGILRRRDIKNALYGFDIPLTPREFEKLWQSYDTEGRGYITYQEFLQRLGIHYSPEVHRPYTEDYFNFLGHFTKPKQIQEEIQELQQITNRTKLAREKLADHYEDITRGLSTLEKSKTGSVPLCKLQKVLRDCGCALKEEELTSLLDSWGVFVHENNYVNHLDFLKALENYSKPRRAQAGDREEDAPTNFSTLNLEELVKSVQGVVNASQQPLSEAFSELDKEGTGFLKPIEFGQVLKEFCHKLTDNQYHYLLRKLGIHLRPSIHWKYFLQNFSSFLEEFDRLWSELPVNPKGRLKFQDFLSRFSIERAASPPAMTTATGDSIAAQRGSSAPEVSEATRSAISSPLRDQRRGLKSRSHPGTPVGTPPLQNLEPIENKLRRQMQGCWRELLKECKEKDVNKQGTITASEFLALVEKFNLDISKEESQQLIVKYDLKNNGRFAYCDFIQSCVLLLKAKETSLMQRMKIQNANKMKEAGAESPSFYSALLRIQPKIVHCWRPMRRSFKTYDEGGSGLLSVANFRKVLRQYGINLSEEEFFHLLEYYDKTLSSKISYNDFLRAFLQ